MIENHSNENDCIVAIFDNPAAENHLESFNATKQKIYLILSATPDPEALIDKATYALEDLNLTKQSEHKYRMQFILPTGAITTDIQAGFIFSKIIKGGNPILIGKFMFCRPLRGMANASPPPDTQTLTIEITNLQAITLEEINAKNYLTNLGWQARAAQTTRIRPKDNNFVNLTAKNLSIVFNNQSSLYLLYKAKKKNNFYLGIYELTTDKMIDIFQLIKKPADLSGFEFHEKAVATDATGTDDADTYVTWFLSHTEGLLRLHVDNLNKKINPSFRETYINLKLTDDVTLTKLQNKKYHFLGCGNKKHDGSAVYARSSDGRKNTVNNSLWFTYAERENPIIQQVNKHVYTIGGQKSAGYDYFIEKKRYEPNDDFSTIYSASYDWSQVIKSSMTKEKEAEFNTKNYRSTVVKNKFFMFHINSFKQPTSFYIFDPRHPTPKLTPKLTELLVSTTIINKVQEGELANYEDIQVTADDTKIYFALTKSDEAQIQTQIIELDTNQL